MMDHSCGLAIIYRNKILLAHPTNAPWTGSFSIPKGLVNHGETYLDAAKREALEEVGLEIGDEFINPTEYIIEYRNRHTTYKQLHWFKTDLSQIPFDEVRHLFPVFPRTQLQLDEVDWAGFMAKEEAETRIFWRQAEILNIL